MDDLTSIIICLSLGNKLVHLHRQHRPQRSPRRQSTSSDENSVGLKNSTTTVRRKKKPVVQYSNIPVSMFPEGGDQEIPDVCMHVCLHVCMHVCLHVC